MALMVAISLAQLIVLLIELAVLTGVHSLAQSEPPSASPQKVVEEVESDAATRAERMSRQGAQVAYQAELGADEARAPGSQTGGAMFRAVEAPLGACCAGPDCTAGPS